MKQWLQPIRVLLLYLATLAIMGTISWAWGDWEIVGQAVLELALLFGGYAGTHWVLVRSKKIQATRWEHQVITCLILFLLFEPGLPWYAYVVIGVLAEILQRVFRFPTGPVANPAALVVAGIALVGMFHKLTGWMGWLPLWWGASFAPRFPLFEGGMSIAALLTIPVAGWVTYKYKKHWIVLAALAAFIPLCYLVLGQSPVFKVLEGTLLFFLLVMAIEPKTSPITRNQQLLYGAVLSTLIIVGIRFVWFEAYTMALVITNVLFNTYKNKALLFRKALKPVQPQTNTMAEAPNEPPQTQG